MGKVNLFDFFSATREVKPPQTRHGAVESMKSGDCDKSVKLLNRACVLAGGILSTRGGEMRLWLALALDAARRRSEAVTLLTALESHPDGDVRTAAKELAFVFRAPELRPAADRLDARRVPVNPLPMEAKVALWREVETGARYTQTTAMDKYPNLNLKSFKGLSSEIAVKPKGSRGGSKDVKTYLAADVDALVARLTAPEPEPVDPRWREVETGARFTATTAMEKYAKLNKMSFKGLRSEIARKPKPGKGKYARDVMTYLAADVDALVAGLAAPPEPDAVDPRWREVEAGTRYTAKTAMAQYSQLQWKHFADLPFEIARQPKIGNTPHAREVKTYAAADIDALVARLAAPDPVDPRWLEVEAGRRYSQATAKKRYPQLTKHSFADLPFEIARRPKFGNQGACDVKTYAAADIDALAASRPKKRARVQEPEPPQEPEPEEEEPEECPVCFDPMTGATATLVTVCGHLFCKDCITDWARSQATCPTCRETFQFAP